ncbi:MAG: phage tail protein [Thermodesulfobacteriota bacterium]
MATTAEAINRGKGFKFRVECNGYPAVLVKTAKGGGLEIGVTEHAGAGQNFTVKEAGMITFEPLDLEGVIPLSGPGVVYFYKWAYQAQDPMTGNGLMPAQYKRDFTLFELDPTGNPFRSHEYQGGFVTKLKPSDREDTAKDKDLIDSITITYDRVVTKEL